MDTKVSLEALLRLPEDQSGATRGSEQQLISFLSALEDPQCSDIDYGALSLGERLDFLAAVSSAPTQEILLAIAAVFKAKAHMATLLPEFMPFSRAAEMSRSSRTGHGRGH